MSNALALYAVQGLNYLMPLILLPFLLRSLQPQGYGAIMFAQSLLGYAAIVVEFGFNFTAARDISLARHDPLAVARIFWTTCAAKLLLLLAMGLIVALLVVIVPVFRKDWPLYAASSLLLIGNVLFPQWYFQGLERLKTVALLQAVAKCVATLAAIFLVRSADDLILAAIILASHQTVGALVGLCLGKAPIPQYFHRPSFLEISHALKNSRALFFANIATTLYLNTNTFVLGIMSGEVAVALYSVAARIIATIQGLAAPVVQAVFPRASLLFVHDRLQAWRLCRHTALVLVPTMVLACAMLLILAPQVIGVLGGHQYLQAIAVLRTMAVVPLLVTVAMLLSQVVMVNIGLAAQLSRIYLTVGLLNLLLLPVLIFAMAERGAALSLVIAETIGPLLMFAVIHRWRLADQESERVER